MAKMGRPTLYNDEIADQIAEQIAAGHYIDAICTAPGMPSTRTILRWEIAHPEFCRLLTHAREAGAHALMGQSRDIADDGSADYKLVSKDGRHEVQIDHEVVARSRLRCDQRYREAQAMAPRYFGQKYQVEHSGSINVTTDTDEVVQRIMEALATGRWKPPGGVQIEELDDTPEDDDPYGVG